MRARREWEPEIKRRILSEMALAGANVPAISRRHGVAQSLLYRWRQDAMIASVFVPVVIAAPEPSAAPETANRCRHGSAGAAPTLDVILGGNRVVRVREGIDAADLKRIVAALEAP